MSQPSRPIPGAGKYRITQNGIVVNLKTGKPVKSRLNEGGYPIVTLYADEGRTTWCLHWLVMRAWGSKKPGPEYEIHHRDEDKQNCHLTNLEWLHPLEHNIVSPHASLPGQLNPMSKLTDGQRTEIRKRAEDGESYKDLARVFGVSEGTVKYTVKGRQRAIRAEIRRFSLLMELKLRKNDHKGGWSNRPLTDLLASLQAEVQELIEAIQDGDPLNVALEAADVANYCCMIADNGGGL